MGAMNKAHKCGRCDNALTLILSIDHVAIMCKRCGWAAKRRQEELFWIARDVHGHTMRLNGWLFVVGPKKKA